MVTGANGQLGNEMRIVATESKDRYIFTDVVEFPGVETTKLDITDLQAVRDIVKANDVKVVINCANPRSRVLTFSSPACRKS